MGGTLAVRVAARPVAKQHGPIHLIRLSRSRGMAKCPQGDLEAEMDSDNSWSGMIMT